MIVILECMRFMIVCGIIMFDSLSSFYSLLRTIHFKTLKPSDFSLCLELSDKSGILSLPSKIEDFFLSRLAKLNDHQIYVKTHLKQNSKFSFKQSNKISNSIFFRPFPTQFSPHLHIYTYDIVTAQAHH